MIYRLTTFHVIISSNPLGIATKPKIEEILSNDQCYVILHLICSRACYVINCWL